MCSHMTVHLQYCDIIWNRYLVFMPSSWHRVLNPLEFLSDNARVPFVIHNKPLSTIPTLCWVTLGGWGLLARGTNLEVRGLELPASPKGRGNGIWVQLPQAKDLVSHSIKPLNSGVPGALGLVNAWRVVYLRKARCSVPLSLTPCSMHLFHVAVPELHPL